MVLLLSMSPRLTMDMDTTLPSTPMDTTLDMDMARGPLMLSQDIMVVPALLSTRAALTTMDLMAMVSTTMARGLLMLDTMAMEWLGATSRLTGHTLPMVSVLLTLTK